MKKLLSKINLKLLVFWVLLVAVLDIMAGYIFIPQKVKDLWSEDIELDRNILIEYLELSKGSPWWIGSDKSKLPCQRLKE